MIEDIKSAFSAIRAEDTLKSDTIRFLRGEIQKRGKSSGRFRAFGEYAAAVTSFAIVFFLVTFSYNLYTTPAAYVDVDVNPSIELALNRFDRVIEASAYNEDGIEIISWLTVKHKSCGEALAVLMDAMEGQGYLFNEGLVSVTLQTDDEKLESELLSVIQTDIENYMIERRHEAKIDVFPVSSDVRILSYEQGISPAKYLAIQELTEVDPTASVESCRSHSISEIKRLTREHGNHHGNGYEYNDNGDNGRDEQINGEYDMQESDLRESDEDNKQTEQGGGHHGTGGVNGRHRGGHN